MAITKGVRAFGIYFIVWACLTFIGGLGALITYLVGNLLGELGYFIAPTALSYVSNAGTVIAAIFLFLAGLSIVREQEDAVKKLLRAVTAYIAVNVIEIVDSIVLVYNFSKSQSMGMWGALSAGWSIAWNIFAILFWIFVIVYFNKERVKSQFEQASLEV